MSARTAVLFIGALLLVSSPASAVQREPIWRLVEDLRIGPAEDGPASFTTIRALTVDRAGRIYVLENQPRDIRVFGADGRFVRHVGRAGSGPGEYQNANGLAWDSLGRLLLVDEQHARNTFFDTSGRLVETLRRPLSGSWGWIWRGGVLNDGRIVEWFRSTAPDGARVGYAVVDAQGNLRDTLLIPPVSGGTPARTWRIERGPTTTYMTVPFAPMTLFALDPRGYVWLASSDRYEILQLGWRGDTVSTARRDIRPEPVTRRERDSVVRVVVGRHGPGPDIDASLIPASKPFFTGLHPDGQGRLWVKVTLPAGATGTAFDVFDAEGRYLARATTPLALGSNVVIRGGVLYADARGADDVPFVVRLRVQPGGR